MPQGDKRILVVDDDASMREAFAEGLRRFGYQCVTAGSADDADQALQREEFALTLLDIAMPGKSGLELLTELLERYPDMAIVMVTGHDELSTAVSAMREGAYDYIAKPVSMTLLIFRVEHALSRRALLLENKAYREQLERMVNELNLRLEQSRHVLAASNTLVQSLLAREQATPEAYFLLQNAVTAFGSGIESLANFAKDIVTKAPDARRAG